ncbi:MAG: alpha/beta hydrolase [Romboutsia sp.]
MNYTEKDFEFVEIENEGFAGDYIKMPSFVTKLWLKSNVKKMRAMMGGESKDIAQRDIDVKEVNINGYARETRVRVYTPEGKEKRSAMVFFHGGGWFAGSIDAVDDYCRAIADRANCVVINVDYDLAPEYKYPAGLEDCYLAVKWTFENGSCLNIDVDNIIVSGDSAGGNYAAIISIMARERKEFNISKQILIYPATDLTAMDDESMGKQGKAFTDVLLDWYLKDKTMVSDKYVSPMLCDDLSNLPSTFIVVGGLDFLKESSLQYANKLDEAGNPVKFSLYQNTRHAFIDNTGNCPQAEALIEEAKEFIQGAKEVIEG